MRKSTAVVRYTITSNLGVKMTIKLTGKYRVEETVQWPNAHRVSMTTDAYYLKGMATLN